MTVRGQLACAWTGPVATFVLFAAMLPLMHIVPPLKPSLSASELASLYRRNHDGMAIGGCLMMAAAAFSMIFFAALAQQMRKMERPAPIWTIVFLISSVLGFYTIIVTELLFSIAVFRPDTSDAAIQTLSDLGFIILVGTGPPAVFQQISVAFAILGDTGREPVFPRWVGYVDIWASVVVISGSLVTLFKVGPFAWNGVFAFWVASIGFGIWIGVNFWAMRRYILRCEQCRGRP